MDTIFGQEKRAILLKNLWFTAIFRHFYGIISQASNFLFFVCIFFLNIQFFIGKVFQSTGNILQLTSIRVDSLIDHHYTLFAIRPVKPV
jgi:hypothetical protein